MNNNEYVQLVVAQLENIKFPYISANWTFNDETTDVWTI